MKKFLTILGAVSLATTSLFAQNADNNSQCPSPQQVIEMLKPLNVPVTKVENIEPFKDIPSLCRVTAVIYGQKEVDFYVSRNGEYLVPFIGKVSFKPAPVKGLNEIWVTSLRNPKNTFRLGYTDDKQRYFIPQLVKVKVTAENIKELDKYVAFTYGNNPNAPTVYFVTDPECPFCKRIEPYLEKWVKEGKLNVKVVWFPLPFHRHAMAKAVSIMCHHKGWEGLKEGYMSSDWNTEKCQQVKQKIEEGKEYLSQLGVKGTPTFIKPNGDMMTGLPQNLEEFQKWLGIKQ
jgi:thiol:disulfide interchange protein DsbC